MQSLLFHVSIHEGCDRQPLEMTRIHFQSGSEKPKKEKIKTIAAAPSQKSAAGWQPSFGSGKKK